jgi:uncharacterized protein (TIGR00369 family)
MDVTTLLDGMGLAKLLDLRVLSAEAERVIAELTVRAEHCTVGETVHGGTLMAFADTLGAVGTVLNLADGQSTTTIESKTNFFAGARIGARLTAESVPLHRGRRTQVWETRIVGDNGRLVAKVTQTQLVIA